MENEKNISGIKQLFLETQPQMT